MDAASVTISLVIENPSRLHAVATRDYLAHSGSSIADAQEFLGTAEKPKLDQCLRQLYDRETPADSGISVQDSFAEIGETADLSAKPRLSTVLHISTGHLTSEERQAIATALGVGNGDDALQIHAEHNGLFLKPNVSGFFVRVPDAEEMKGLDLTPEMLRILELAHSHQAWQVHFDADEEPIAGLPVFSDRQLILRDFSTPNALADEPLYWSNADGWVDRASADRYFIEEAEQSRLPMFGAPKWVDAEDPADNPFQLA